MIDSQQALDLLSQGPFQTLAQIASVLEPGAEADSRAQVTVHTKQGQSWTGIPVRTVSNQNGAFVILELVPKKTTFILLQSEVSAIEIENLGGLYDLLEKPWSRDIGDHNLSKLQLFREIDSLGKEVGAIEIKLDFDGFPADQGSPSALLVWIQYLKAELLKVRSSDLGKTAIAEIQQIQIKYGAGSNICSRQGATVIFEINLTKETFEKARIAQLLNKVL